MKAGMILITPDCNLISLIKSAPNVIAQIFQLFRYLRLLSFLILIVKLRGFMHTMSLTWHSGLSKTLEPPLYFFFFFEGARRYYIILSGLEE